MNIEGHTHRCFHYESPIGDRRGKMGSLLIAKELLLSCALLEHIADGIRLLARRRGHSHRVL